MYINAVHISWYIALIIIGAIIGQFIKISNKRIIENKKIFSRDILSEFRNKFKLNHGTILTIVVLYLIVLYKTGIKEGLINNLLLIKYLVLIPILISIIMIDYNKKIIPNRLTLTIFETGIIFAFLYGIDNLFKARDYLLAMIIGGLIFGIIALFGRIIAGKEAMGMGDIKLIATLGLYFGIPLTISISIISFIISALFSIILVALKKKKGKEYKIDEYITFGPCIGVAAILCMIVPEQTIISVLLTIFTLGRYKA